MHDAQTDGILDGVLRASTIAVFAHYGVQLDAGAPSVARSLPSHRAIGVIGFTGNHVRGTVALAASAEILERSRPATGATAIPQGDLVRDWVGELANLLVGRIGLALSRHGLDIRLSIPVALSGEALQVSAASPGRTRCWDFTSEAGNVRTWLELELDAGVALDPESTASPDALRIGEPVLF